MKKSVIKNEQGSATIEFLSMVPLVLLVMLLFWQFLVAGYAVIITQSAANEAAKVYSAADVNSSPASAKAAAEEAARKVINHSGKNLEFENLSTNLTGRDFTMTVKVNMNLLFIPKDIVGTLSQVTFSKSINGRVMD
ncbi:TadE/TadG family type IV pilus assembly protein [Heyndrickxia sp. NPDC080065]|uniref:TadE/TadG family type IV pilus assembly protein n=1 Tax=Heyndrickxia sp. NPDC080065 TaxID=3390568 RepID=UPI003CFDC100